MGLWKSFACPKCSHSWEGILDVCSRCGARAAPQSGISSCLASGRPPGAAGGRNTPYSARSYDAAFKRNFEILGISNLYHRDGVPVVTKRKAPKLRYNSMPEWAGKQEPIRAYAGAEQMRREGVVLPPMMIEGKPYAPPNVHPVVEPGAIVGGGLSASMRAATVITHRYQPK